jgi:hypothetical protein
MCLGLQLCRTWRSLSATWNAGVHLRRLTATERNAGANNGERHRGHLAQSVTQSGRRVRAWGLGWGAGVTSEVSACCAPSAEVRKSVSEMESEYGDGRRAQAHACDRAGQELGAQLLRILSHHTERDEAVATTLRSAVAGLET